VCNFLKINLLRLSVLIISFTSEELKIVHYDFLTLENAPTKKNNFDGKYLEGEQEQKGHHKTKQAHSFGQSESQNGV